MGRCVVLRLGATERGMASTNRPGRAQHQPRRLAPRHTESEAVRQLRETLIRHYSHPEEFDLRSEADRYAGTHNCLLSPKNSSAPMRADLSPSTVSCHRPTVVLCVTQTTGSATSWRPN